MLHANHFWNCSVILLLSLSLSLSAADDSSDLFHGELISVLESAYKQAPFRVHHIVDSLNNKAGRHPYPFNYAIFDGKPGVSKSTLALAVAYKSARKVNKFRAADFMNLESRYATAVKLNNTLRNLEHTDQKTVIILEEVNELLINYDYDSTYGDVDAPSVVLCDFWDKIKHSQNIFFIGTTTGIGGFSPRTISRLQAAIITVVAPNETETEQRERHHQERLQHQDALAKDQRFLAYAGIAIGIVGTGAVIYFSPTKP